MSAPVIDHHADLIAAGTLLYAFDAAFPAPASVYKANGGVAANVYVSGNYAQSSAHVKELRAAGVAPWPNYEVGLWELVSNRATGQAAGRRGIADAIRCGFPADGTIWFPFSVDVSVPTSRYGEVADAFLGIQDVNAGRYRISFYGQGDLARYLRTQGIIHERCWLSASSSFPGWNPSSLDICVWQQVGSFIPGHSTDRNVITDPYALGAWWPDNSPYGDNMPTPAEYAKAVWDYRLVHLDATSHQDLPTHSASEWLTGTNAGERDDATTSAVAAVAANVTAIKAAIANIASVTLTDAQVTAIANAIAAKMPTVPTFKIDGTLTPSTPPQ